MGHHTSSTDQELARDPRHEGVPGVLSEYLAEDSDPKYEVDPSAPAIHERDIGLIKVFQDSRSALIRSQHTKSAGVAAAGGSTFT